MMQKMQKRCKRRLNNGYVGGLHNCGFMGDWIIYYNLVVVENLYMDMGLVG